MFARILAVFVIAGCIASIAVWAMESDGPSPSPAVVAAPITTGTAEVPAADVPAANTLAQCADLDQDGCVDSGFDPARDGLAFGNESATGALSSAGLMALFGAESVCASVTAKGCVLYPAAAQWARQVNEAMVGGRGEGMAVVAQRIFSGEVSIEDLEPDARAAAELEASNPAVSGAIETWWATQLLPPVEDAAIASRLYSPSSIVQELSSGLLSGTGYTLGLTREGGAHSVLPVAIHRRGEQYAIAVYDSDLPGTRQEILVDPASERWTYVPGVEALPGGAWQGGIGTMELTPMSIRALPARAPFDASMLALSPAGRRDSDRVTVFVTSPDPSARVGVALTIRGRTFSISEPGARVPRGVRVRRVLGSGFAGSGVVVTIDRGRVRSFAAAPIASGVPGSQHSTTISIDAPGRPRITVRSPRTLTAEALPGVRLALGRGARGEFPIIASEAGRTLIRGPQVNIANGLNSVNLTLPSRSILVEVRSGKARGGRDQTAQIKYRSRQGRVLAGTSIPFGTPSGRVRVADLSVSSTGRVVAEAEGFARPVPIDTAVLEVLQAVSTSSEGAAQAGDGSGPADSSRGDAAQLAIAVSNVRRSGIAGTPVRLTSSGGSGTGAVTFVVTGEHCSIVRDELIARAPTTCRVTATRAGSGNFAPWASAPVAFAFRPAAQARLAVSNRSRPGPAGTPVRLMTSGGSGGGAVTFTVRGRGCSVARNVLVASRPGTCVVTASKSASGIYSGARSAPRSLTFPAASQRELVVATKTLSWPVGASVPLESRGGSGGGAVTFVASGPGCEVVGSTLTAAAPATCAVTAMKAASGIYRSAESATLQVIFE